MLHATIRHSTVQPFKQTHSETKRQRNTHGPKEHPTVRFLIQQNPVYRRFHPVPKGQRLGLHVCTSINGACASGTQCIMGLEPRDIIVIWRMDRWVFWGHGIDTGRGQRACRVWSGYIVVHQLMKNLSLGRKRFIPLPVEERSQEVIREKICTSSGSTYGLEGAKPHKS